jgi:hypothetical protein
MLSVLAVLAVSSAYAQSGNRQTAYIPFAFSVGNKDFPAGEYSITRLNPSADKTALGIMSADRRDGSIVLTTPIQAAKASEKAVLVFRRYGDQYFLAQVWTPADAMGLAVSRSRAERKLARTDSAPERMTVALNSRKR